MPSDATPPPRGTPIADQAFYEGVDQVTGDRIARLERDAARMRGWIESCVCGSPVGESARTLLKELDS